MKYFEWFLTLKGYSASSMFLGHLGIYLSVHLLEFSYHLDQFPCLYGKKTTLSSHSVKFLKIYFIPGDLSSPHRETETKCLDTKLHLCFIAVLARKSYLSISLSF